MNIGSIATDGDYYYVLMTPNLFDICWNSLPHQNREMEARRGLGGKGYMSFELGTGILTEIESKEAGLRRPRAA